MSHTASCSAREFSTRAALLGEQALDVVNGLTVRMQLVHVEMLESLRSAVISEVASSLASLQVTEEGRLGGCLPAHTTGPLEKTVSRGPFPPFVCLLLRPWMMVSTLTSRLL